MNSHKKEKLRQVPLAWDLTATQTADHLERTIQGPYGLRTEAENLLEGDLPLRILTGGFPRECLAGKEKSSMMDAPRVAPAGRSMDHHMVVVGGMTHRTGGNHFAERACVKEEERG